MRRAVMVAVLVCVAACSSQPSNAVCTTDTNRSTVACTPAPSGCLGSDLGYPDDRTYGPSCEAPRHDDTSSCATLYACDTSGATPQWQVVLGF